MRAIAMSRTGTPLKTRTLLVCMPGKNAATSREMPKAPSRPMAEPVSASFARN
jgi:hypothetical protein